MFFSIVELELKKSLFDVEFPPGEIDFEESHFRQIGPLHAEGVAELVSPLTEEIRISGKLAVDMEIPCDRCLEAAGLPIRENFDLYYRPAPKGNIGNEVAIDDGEAQIGFYDGKGIELEEVLREHILLALPMQLVCNEDCAGICPHCGVNRNIGDCQCRAEPVHETFAALKGFKPSAKTGS